MGRSCCSIWIRSRVGPPPRPPQRGPREGAPSPCAANRGQRNSPPIPVPVLRPASPRPGGTEPATVPICLHLLSFVVHPLCWREIGGKYVRRYGGDHRASPARTSDRGLRWPLRCSAVLPYLPR